MRIGRQGLLAGSCLALVTGCRRERGPSVLTDDPDCLDSIHDRRPDLAASYTRFLTERLAIHKALATRFTRADDSPLTPEQLEALRALGYIR